MQIPDELYQSILGTMPIPCIDLIVFNGAREVLLVRRVNEPARGQWWFPGGRVRFGETRETAAKRQLLEECGLHAASMKELWTRDVILPLESSTLMRHGITTLYAVNVDSSAQVMLDDQATDFAWKTPSIWQKESLHPFVSEILSEFKDRLSKKMKLQA